MVKLTNYIGIVLLLGVFFFGCTSNTLEGQLLENKPPTVWLSAAPPEGSLTRYTLQLFWGGWDPDGEIRHYEYAITNNEGGAFDPADTTGADKWGRVLRNDSTFTFSADLVADSTDLDPNNLGAIDFLRSHTFFIRAVDDQGLASAKPAYRSFTSQTLSPVVDVVVPVANGFNAAEVPPISTFEWIGKDYVSNERELQDPDSVRWILVPTRLFNGNWSATLDYIRNNPDAPEWSKWRYYKASGDSGRFWTTPALELRNTYLFAVMAKDEAGAVTPVFDEDRNVRRISVNERNNGPILQVYNNFIGSITSASPNTPPVIIDLPANIPMCFSFKANAAGYGGVASAYRYGWDIQDFNDPTQWENDFTPFVLKCGTPPIPCGDTPCRAWQFDSHTFYIEVIDNSGYSSRVAVTVNVLPFSMTKPLLVVDDWKENSAGFAATNGAVPSDAEHDAFWEEMLVDVQGFDPRIDVIEVVEDLPITAFADYKSVIWVATASYLGTTSSFLNQVIRFVDPTAPTGGGKTTPNILALFASAGGHVLLAGEQVMTASINRGSFTPAAPAFPLIFRYELGGDQDGDYEDSNVGVRGIGEDSFAYRECCLNVVDIAYVGNPLGIRRGKAGCPVNTIRRAPQSGRNDGLRVALPLDDEYEFPTLNLRPDVGGPNAWYAETQLGLNSDVYNPAYFAEVPMVVSTAPCNAVAEIVPRRDCFKPIYGNGCYNDGSSESRPKSRIYNAPVAFWTTVYEDRIPDAGGIGARSAIWGFHAVYFNKLQVKAALDIVLFDEWQLRQLPPTTSVQREESLR
jgi:hypothetical protein